MPSILGDEDKDTVKRFVPKQSNKIQAVAVARLYVAYPDRSKWTYTGLQGAIVLANDLVGNTYWLKMVDISVRATPVVLRGSPVLTTASQSSGRGVIWDQEIFDAWSYNQDRTFFHTFELEECLAGLSFVDEKEAKQFKKKMDEREKNASRATRSTPFGGGAQPTSKFGLLGGLFHRHLSAPAPAQPDKSAQPSPHASVLALGTNGTHPPSEFALLDAFDPLWREHFGQDLSQKGLTDAFIKENQEFIVDFLREEQAKMERQGTHVSPAPPRPPPPTNGHDPRGGRAPPPPPPPPPGAASSPSPSSAKRAVPPPPPAPRRSVKADAPSHDDSPPPREPSPPRPRFNAPPPLPEAGRFAHPKPAPAANPGPPPPPPRPSKTPMEPENQGHKLAVPPASAGQRMPPLPTPGRGPAPPARSNDGQLALAAAPPPLPPKVPTGNAPPPLPPATSRPVPPPPSSGAPPPAPPLPSSHAPPPPPLPSSGAPPPPPLTSSSAPPPPPLSSKAPAPATAAPDKGRSAMLGDIQRAGGISSLKKVDKSQIRDRSAAQVGGGGDAGAPPAGAPAAGGGGGMADALAAALQKRKEKVSKSGEYPVAAARTRRNADAGPRRRGRRR